MLLLRHQPNSRHKLRLGPMRICPFSTPFLRDFRKEIRRHSRIKGIRLLKIALHRPNSYSFADRYEADARFMTA